MKKLLLLLPLFSVINSQDLSKIKYKYSLPDLPYAFDALEPYIDAKTMEIHHNKHNQKYVDELNSALVNNPELQNKTLEHLLKNLDQIKDAKTRKAVRENGGGHWNHSFFWKVMKANKGSELPKPTSKIAKVINKTFGSFEKFQEKFNEAAKKVFGSGWAWLCVDKSNNLVVTSTPNQDTPISEGLKPILALDVWEHAYYLKYQNKRPDYITAWWYVINWDQVEKNYYMKFV